MTGERSSIAPWVASHSGVDALDLMGAGELDWASMEAASAESLKRVYTPVKGLPAVSLERISAFTELKTIWHTKALG